MRVEMPPANAMPFLALDDDSLHHDFDASWSSGHDALWRHLIVTLMQGTEVRGISKHVDLSWCIDNALDGQ